MAKIKSFGAFLALLFLAFLLAPIVNATVIKGNTYDFSLNKINNVVVEIDSSPKQTYVVKDGSYSFTLEQGSYTIMALQKSGAETIAKAEEKVDIRRDGEFSVDLILFPVIDDGSIDDVNAGVSFADEKSLRFIYIIVAVVLFVIIGLSIRFFSKRKAGHNSKESKKFAKKSRKAKRAEKKQEEKSQTESVTESKTLGLSKSGTLRGTSQTTFVKKEESKEQKGYLTDVYDSEKIIEILKKHGGRATQKDIRKDIPLSEAKISLMIAELESKGKVEKIKKGRGNIIILK